MHDCVQPALHVTGDRPFVFGFNAHPVSLHALTDAIAGAHGAWKKQFGEEGEGKVGEAVPTQPKSVGFGVGPDVVPPGSHAEATRGGHRGKEGWRRLLQGMKKNSEGEVEGGREKGSRTGVAFIATMVGGVGTGGTGVESGKTQHSECASGRQGKAACGGGEAGVHPGGGEGEAPLIAATPPFWPKTHLLRASSADHTFF